MKLKDLKKGELFTLKEIAEPRDAQVYIREDYDRSEGKYWAQKFSDISAGRYLSGDREVFTDFVF